ncbi:MAG: diaminopimelate decarboxylase [Candidatus Izemoplasmataceae bacterium]
MELFGTQKINESGMLTVGGVSLAALKEKYGTPLYVMDETHIRRQCQYFTQRFTHPSVKSEVIYASKAFLTKAMCTLIEQEGLSLDVVSGGELFTAKQANYPMDKVYFHGNNKSIEEIQMAIDYGVGVLIVDHEVELDLMIGLLNKDHSVNVLLRINPGIEAHTHEFIATTKNDSKFGLSIFNETTIDVIKRMVNQPNINFLGFHSHIGSQIFESDSFYKHAQVVLEYIARLKNDFNIQVDVMNLGGGFGVRYIEEDLPIVDDTFLTNMLNFIHNVSKKLHISAPKVCIEPGRAIVANAGLTLYTVATTKKTFGEKQYVFVDGSMADHLRTVLYDATYTGVLANRMYESHSQPYTVTGKACESGDIIIRKALLPTPQANDLLVVLSTGAYHYSMASNYNRLRRPAVVFVKEGTSKLVVRRERYEDLIQYDEAL